MAEVYLYEGHLTGVTQSPARPYSFTLRGRGLAACFYFWFLFFNLVSSLLTALFLSLGSKVTVSPDVLYLHSCAVTLCE